MNTTLQQLSETVAKIEEVENAVRALDEKILDINSRLEALTKYVETLTLPPVPPDEPELPVEPESDYIVVTDYYYPGDTDYSQAIMRAHADLKDGGTLLFPEGNYRIVPEIIKIPANVTWKGHGIARLYTKETNIYNILINTAGADNITIDNIVFDQREDAALLPITSPYKGAIIIYISNSNNVRISNCTFFGYGICTVLCDCYDGTMANQYNEFTDNKMYWQRKVDSLYDVSIAHLQAKSLYCLNNHIECMESPFKTWKARTGIEAHFPNGTVNNNTIIGCEVGAIHCNWPSSWPQYDPTYVGNPEFSLNKISKCIIGFELWSSFAYDNRITKNLLIDNNEIELYRDFKSRPMSGIVFYFGGKKGYYENTEITNNKIVFAWDKTLYADIKAVQRAYNYLELGDNTGVICANVQTDIRGLTITDNTVNSYPYSFINLLRRPTGLHTDVLISGNTIIDCAYCVPYMTKYKAIYSIGTVDGITIKQNIVSNPTLAAKAEIEKQEPVTNYVYG